MLLAAQPVASADSQGGAILKGVGVLKLHTLPKISGGPGCC